MLILVFHVLAICTVITAEVRMFTGNLLGAGSGLGPRRLGAALAPGLALFALRPAQKINFVKTKCKKDWSGWNSSHSSLI